jgi:hypothetical protein
VYQTESGDRRSGPRAIASGWYHIARLPIT